MEDNDKNKTAPKSSIGVDEEQYDFEINNNNTIIPQKITGYNDEIITNFFNLSLDKIVNMIQELMQDYEVKYSSTDIGVSKIFFDCFRDKIVYATEPKSWFIYNGKYWVKDNGHLYLMELMKVFCIAYVRYSSYFDDQALERYTKGIDRRIKRESLLKDATSILPKSITMFDSHKLLFNCKNGTYNLETNKLQEYNPFDYITKMSNVNFDPDANCDRWIQFISEIMQGDVENQKFLKKALGYALSGETNLECFFIFYGNTTRNGKSTACETISYLLGDYATHSQPKTLAKNRKDGSAPTPDIARLKGARFVSMAEPEKGLEIDVSLVKQLTGGDKYTGRLLHENPIEFYPEFKIFINTNHLPRVSDDTIFTSGRVKILPFERHFILEEQDPHLKCKLKTDEMLSGILNWLINGYCLLKSEGLQTPPSVELATKEYQEESDLVGTFLTEKFVERKGSYMRTTTLYELYGDWCKTSGYHAFGEKNFRNEIKKRYEMVKHSDGNVFKGIALKEDVEEKSDYTIISNEKTFTPTYTEQASSQKEQPICVEQIQQAPLQKSYEQQYNEFQNKRNKCNSKASSIEEKEIVLNDWFEIDGNDNDDLPD